MKILVVINRLGVGGAERLAIDDINELLRRGIDVQLLTLKPEKKENSLTSDCKIPLEKWKIIDFKFFFDLFAWLSFIRFVHEYKPDIVISHLWYSNTISRIVSKVCGITTHLVFEHNVYDLVKSKKMFLIDRILQSFSTKIIAVSETVKESLLRNGIRHDRILVVHNGVDTSRYLNIRSDNQNDKFLARDEFVYIFIGRLIKQKGIDVLLEAFRKINSGVLLVVGDGADKEMLLRYRDRIGLQNRVHFLGIRQDVPNLLAIADCFVLPSRYEGLPIVLIEAMVSGKAIIISDFESGKELINNGENGLIVPRENSEILSLAMRKMYEDTNLRSRLGNQAGLDAKKFSIKYHVDALLRIANSISLV